MEDRDTRAERELSGALWPQTTKHTDRSPDLKGRALVGGRRYRLSAWRKTNRSGGEFWSLAFTPSDETTAD